MGYDTSFEGRFNLDRRLSSAHAAYLKAFAGTRRMVRDPEKAAKRPDPVREDAGLPVGPQGCYFVGAQGLCGQEYPPGSISEPGAEDVLDHNREPDEQPGLWCEWVPTEDHEAIEWSGGEKFYNYVKWLQYLIDHFLGPWGYKLNGAVRWRGERQGDTGTITVVDNVVTTTEASATKRLVGGPKNLAELKEALDRGDYKDNYVEIRVDNDSIVASVFEPGCSPFDDEDDDPEPMFSLRLGSEPEAVLVDALQLLGFENADRV